MGYKYQAASTFSAPSSRPAIPSCVHPAPVATEDSSAHSTRDHWDAAQAPRAQSSCSSSQSDRSVRFADKPVFEPQVPYQPHHRAGSPSSQTSSTPSLSHSADSEHDDVKCPSTPEFKPAELDFEAPTGLPVCSPSPSTLSSQKMPYKYEAASISTQAASISARPSWQPISSRARSASVATEDSSAHSTCDRQDAAQSPREQISRGSSRSDRSVRFADKPVFEPQVPYQPRHRAGSPSSQASSAPSLSFSAGSEHGDDTKCPPRPEFKPLELGLGAKPSKSCLSKHKSEPHPAHVAASSTIEQIVHEFEAYVVAFQHPRELDFAAPAADSSVVPALLFTPNNRPLFEHVQRLEALQTELYGIRSYGDHGIRKAHNEAVVMIRHELDWLKRVQARIWNKLMQEQPKRFRRK